MFKRGAEPDPVVPLLDLPNGNLRPYQIPAAKHLLSGPFVLGDDVGVGKTHPTLAALHSLLASDTIDGALIICPTSLEGQWCEAVAEFLQMEATPIRAGQPPETGKISVCTFARVRRDEYFEAIYSKIANPRWAVCIEEVHKIATWGTQQFEAVRILTKRTHFLWALSGTEVRNQPDSYYPIYYLVRNRFLDRDDYLSYFQGGNGKWRPGKLTALQAVRNQFTLRRVKKDVLKDLPPKTEIRIPLRMTGKLAKLYTDMQKKEGVVLETKDDFEEITAKGILSKITRLFQLASWPGTLGEVGVDLTKTPKWDALLNILENHSDESVIIWSHWPDTIQAIAKALEREFKTKVPTVFGATSRTMRDKARKAFMSGKARFLVANPLAYGEGVNLQKGSVAVYWDLNHRKDTWIQSQDRIYRSGQTLAVFIYYLLYCNTIEPKCLDWLQEKRYLEEKITGKGNQV